jgi:hypothetical protein
MASERSIVKKKGFVRKLILNRETLTTLELKGAVAAGNTNVSCSCGVACSDVSVCWSTQIKPLCA